MLAALLALLVAAGAGMWLLAGAGGEMTRRHVVVGGVPLDEVHPSDVGGGRRPGVVVAHGFAGSARLMAQFGDSLAARGYVVVLLDFSGHGANTRPLPEGTAGTEASTAALQHDLDVATAHLRGLPDVDPSRIALAGHSMGASAVTRYAAAHPEITATVAISLPDASTVLPYRPARLLLLVGGLEFPNFRAEAERAAGPAREGRSMVVVPAVEHISILYAPRTHREMIAWLDDSFGGPAADRSPPAPFRRVGGAAVLLLSLLIGLYPVARLLFGGARAGWPRFSVPQLGPVVAVAAAAAAFAALVAPLLPTSRLPLALGGYVVGFTATTGAVILGYRRWRGANFPALTPVARPGKLRLAFATPVLIGYAATAIALPLHLGLTHVLPVGARWWLLVLVWAAFAVLAYAAELVTAGNSFGVLAVSAVAVIALTGAAVVGLTGGFLLLIVPLLAVLLLWQAVWSAVLHRFSAPSWLIALVGSLVVAWPLATALPMIG
ncbi:dienelactone hydrolase [Actinoplanes sp. ATCC 53533]|uniref:dienelactone hydrolase family protein n=1 Tax=Actinoplanes sp. ATCC 53533 TaxID=1288362 RepID=UPI000F7676D0|nr:alpha/beta fold hydrolase [Actinoplanes sp. ATCC 53533]RSM65039.1 dienelactone hydrolase [Actinoplanes sp. ATCC 53533]